MGVRLKGEQDLLIFLGYMGWGRVGWGGVEWWNTFVLIFKPPSCPRDVKGPDVSTKNPVMACNEQAYGFQS